MAPKVSDSVHYFPGPSDRARMGTGPLAAIVTATYPNLPDVVNLQVFTPYGFVFGAAGVTRRGGTPESPDAWDWP